MRKWRITPVCVAGAVAASLIALAIGAAADNGSTSNNYVNQHPDVAARSCIAIGNGSRDCVIAAWRVGRLGELIAVTQQ
jgi:hypothetical protein